MTVALAYKAYLANKSQLLIYSFNHLLIHTFNHLHSTPKALDSEGHHELD